MTTAEQDSRDLAKLETRPPQGMTWAVFAVLVVIAHTLLRIEAKFPAITETNK